MSTQEELLKILPQLYTDLKAGKMDTLNEFLVVYKHVKVHELTSETEKLLLKEMCQDATKTIELQCGREYGFGEIKGDKQATELYKLTPEQVAGLPKKQYSR